MSADNLARLKHSKRKLCHTYLLCGYKASSLTLSHVVSQYIYPV